MALAVVAMLLLLAGCSSLVPDSGEGGPTTAPERTDRTTTRPTETATAVPTPATRTPIPTLTTTERVAEPPSPRAVATNVSHEPDVDTIYRRVERLRGLNATQQVTVEAHDVDIFTREHGELSPGEPFDYPDDGPNMPTAETKVLQLYSAERVPVLAAAASGFAQATSVGVANATAYERLFPDSFDVLLVHEFAHTLQEQHGLIDYRTVPLTTDGFHAQQMLREGDATLTAHRYWRRYDTGGVDPLAARNRTRPRGYWTLGLSDKTRYYGALYLRTVPDSRRDAYVANPPDTAAEVMHPNATWDLPGPPVRAPTPDGWTATGDNRVGELAIRYALRNGGLDYRRAATASTGWWNDSLLLFERDDTVAASWGIRFADADDAAEFASAWRAMLAARNATATDGVLSVPETPHAPAMQYVVATDGPVVYVAAGGNRSVVAAVADAFPSSATVTHARGCPGSDGDDGRCGEAVATNRRRAT